MHISTPHRPMTRSVSNDGLSMNSHRNPRPIRKHLSFQPVNGQSDSESIDEERSLACVNEIMPGSILNSKQIDANESDQYRLLNGPLQNRTAIDEYDDNQNETPSIEEALQIIHEPENHSCITPEEEVSNGFFLHNQEMGLLNSNMKSPCDFTSSSPDIMADTKGALSSLTDDTGIHVPSDDIPETMDEDYSLKDYTVSMDSDMDEPSRYHQENESRTNFQRESLSPCPSSVSAKSQAGSSASSSSGVKMTSFAEQKLRKLNHADGRSSGSSSQKTTPEGSELNIPHVVAWGLIPEETTPQQEKDTTQFLASEMVHLKMKLEEKRRAIEAQKKKVEAAFTRQRQKMGRTAFLTVVKKKGDSISPVREEAIGAQSKKDATDLSRVKPLDEKEHQEADEQRSGERAQATWLKSPTTPVEGEKQWSLASPTEETLSEVEIGEYTKSIEKLNSSLSLLQQEMQRLALQQDVLMQMREQQQSWVISPPQPSPQKQIRELKSAIRPTGSVSPVQSFTVESPRPIHRSPQISNRKTVSFPPKQQRTPRPNELKLSPLNRTLTPPQSVDSLPRLRRFSPSQTQTTSFVCFGDDSTPCETQSKESPLEDNRPIEEVANREVEKEMAFEQDTHKSEGGDIAPYASTVSEVLAEPIIETVCLTRDRQSFPGFSSFKNANLIEVSLSDLKPSDVLPLDENDDDESERERFDEDQKVCCGFFFKV